MVFTVTAGVCRLLIFYRKFVLDSLINVYSNFLDSKKNFICVRCNNSKFILLISVKDLDQSCQLLCQAEVPKVRAVSTGSRSGSSWGLASAWPRGRSLAGSQPSGEFSYFLNSYSIKTVFVHGWGYGEVVLVTP